MKVIFVCLGNICRSPMAESIFKQLVCKSDRQRDIEVISRATSDEESGNNIYPSAKRILAEHGLTCEHRSQKLTYDEICSADYVIAMDESNVRNILRISGGQFADKIHKLCDYTDDPHDIADPWYTRDFETAYKEISHGCNCFLKYLEEVHPI